MSDKKPLTDEELVKKYEKGAAGINEGLEKAVKKKKFDVVNKPKDNKKPA